MDSLASLRVSDSWMNAVTLPSCLLQGFSPGLPYTGYNVLGLTFAEDKRITKEKTEKEELET